MGFYIVQILFWGIPIGTAALFLTSLTLYILGRRRNKKQPDSVPARTQRTRLLLAIISGTVLATLALVVIGLIALLATAVAYM